jgi:heme-degrading monooxygenase HmoA
MKMNQTEMEVLYTLGIWTTLPGKEEEFMKAWKEFAKWTQIHLHGSGTAQLLQDVDQPQRFISLGPWDNRESIQEWRASPEFKNAVLTFRQLCTEIKPMTMQEVVRL